MATKVDSIVISSVRSRHDLCLPHQESDLITNLLRPQRHHFLIPWSPFSFVMFTYIRLDSKRGLRILQASRNLVKIHFTVGCKFNWRKPFWPFEHYCGLLGGFIFIREIVGARNGQEELSHANCK